MGRILIVGAGQSGLLLALGLQSQGRDVTLVTNRTAAELRAGRVTSTQAMFDTALQIERDLGLNFWEDRTPRAGGLGISAAAPGSTARTPAVDFVGTLPGFAQSVDQRVKMAGWLETFEQRGGRVVVHGVSVSDLDRLAESYDLTVVATGRGELARLFPTDPEATEFTEPQRALAVGYVHGVLPRDSYTGGPDIQCSAVPGVGELFVIPALTHSGPCDILFFEGVPGGPLDVFEDVPDPEAFLALMLRKIREHVPWEYERVRGAELTDGRAILAGRYTPAVRRPVGVLPSGRTVLGAGDAVVCNDPVSGQGANTAARCGAHYLHAVLQRGERPFDRGWMQAVFDRYWEHARHVVRWTNALLRPTPEHVRELLVAAEQLEPVADRIAGGFDDPADFEEFWYEPRSAADFLAKVRASLGISSAR